MGGDPRRARPTRRVSETATPADGGATWQPSPVSYAVAPDGTHVAYQTVGRGAPVLVLSDGFIPIDTMDSEPALARALRRLAAGHTVVRHDRRGIGLSDRVADATLDDWVADAVAVLDAVGAARASVLAPTDAGLIALALASTHPERVDRLVIVNGFACLLRGGEDDVGLDATVARSARKRATSARGDDAQDFDLLSMIAPSVAEDTRFRRWWDDAGRRGATPGSAAAFRAVTEEADLRTVLPSIQTPTLVVQRRDNWYAGPAQGRRLAAGLPNSEYVELSGSDAVWWVGEQAPLLDRIIDWLAGDAGPARSDRPFVSILFTDIVDSTSRAGAAGDEAWVRTLDAFDRHSHRVVAEYGGEIVKSTGDGILAWFLEPSSAVRCGLQLVEGCAGLGVPIRCGVHAGEVEFIGNDVAGMAVHVAARTVDVASAGTVVVTSAVLDRATDPALSYADLGARRFKGVSGPTTVFRAEIPESSDDDS